uniref:Uncharacterized protein n=1 Tax=Arundo donax TaxID=35708 RepID=A0A0A9GDX1_ARUDO
MVRVRRGTGVARWIRDSARRKWNASMRFDGEAEAEAEPLAGARRLGLGFGGGGGGGGAVLFAAMNVA